MNRHRITVRLINGLVVCLVAAAHSVAIAKPAITNEKELPRFSYPVTGSASALVDSSDATFAVFATKVRTDLNHVLDGYDVQDKSTLRDLLSERLDLQELGGDYRGALQTAIQLNGLEEKPAAKLTNELFAISRLQAAIDAQGVGSAAYQQAFSRHFRTALAPLPWDIVRDSVRIEDASMLLTTHAVVVGRVATDIDPAVAKSGAVDNDEAALLISARVALKAGIPLAGAASTELLAYIAAHGAAKPDIWAAREVTLHDSQHLTPVLIGIWDSGVDVSDFPQQVFTDTTPTATGTHGLAFDDLGNPQKGWLIPLTAQQRKAYPEIRSIIAGMSDVREGISSPEADAVVKKFATLSVEQIHQLDLDAKVIGHYLHGTHCAGIAVRGNPAARLVVARFNDELPDMPFAPTAEWVRRLGADFQQFADYFRVHNVRVVNMSWGDDPREFEEWLSKTGGGADPAQRKQHAAELYAMWRAAIESAIKSAPGTLFVSAAGNSNDDPGFIDDVPSSLHLPNLIAVGAVNQSGDETSFTSHGSSVVVDADGYDVVSYVPGGVKLKLSGTSMASPNVVNLAAKLFALDPALTPAAVIDLIKQGATSSTDGRRHLIDEKRSVALLEAGHKS